MDAHDAFRLAIVILAGGVIVCGLSLRRVLRELAELRAFLVPLGFHPAPRQTRWLPTLLSFAGAAFLVALGSLGLALDWAQR